MFPRARRNGQFGYRAQIMFSNGDYVVPTKAVFPTKRAALESAANWIRTNSETDLRNRFSVYSSNYIPSHTST